MTTEIPLKIAGKFVICQKAEWSELFMLHLYLWFHWKTVLYRRKELKKKFSAIGCSGRTDKQTIQQKHFFLDIYSIHTFMYSHEFISVDPCEPQVCVCLDMLRGLLIFWRTSWALSSSWLPPKKKKKILKIWAWEVKWWNLLLGWLLKIMVSNHVSLTESVPL